MQMGAEHKFDLTSDVTHLIVGNTDTQKYRYVARERPDVKVVLPTFISAVREEWMKGGETDVEGLEGAYRVKTLWELQICLTGFDDGALGAVEH
jgi:DNA replication regulator DPB11